MGLLAIERTMFAILIATYFYLRLYVPEWPPSLPRPELFYGTLDTLVLVVSAVPNEWVKRAAERQDSRKVRLGLIVCPAFAVAFLAVRAFEFLGLHCHWDTDALDTGVLTALMFTGRIEGTRFVDVAENAV
jgi:heme/copper-type cytochrome/quinol oxidase subunit 3